MNDLIKIDDENYGLVKETTDTIYSIEKQIQDLKALQDKYKATLLKEMEKVNCVNINTDKFVVTYVNPSYRETFDSKRFQKENKKLYDEYIKLSPVKSSIRIKLKEE